MVDRELEGDQHRRGERGDLGERAPAGDERDQHGEQRRGGEHHVLGPLDAVDLAPDAERRGPVELARDGPVDKGPPGRGR